MQYRLTKRGWLVILLLTVVLLFGLYQFFSPPAVPNDADQEPAYDPPEDLVKEEDNEPPKEDVQDDGGKEEDPLVVEEVFFPYQETVYFLADKAIPLEHQMEKVDKFIWYAKKHQDQVIEIVGHTNGYPEFEDGKIAAALSSERAEVIYDYLLLHGIKPDRIDYYGVGSTRQEDRSGTASSQAENRKAELRFRPIE